MQAMEKITPKHGFKSIFLECAFVYGKSVQPLNDCTQTKIRLFNPDEGERIIMFLYSQDLSNCTTG